MKSMMCQIIEELRAIKLSQEEERKETKYQLSQLNAHLTYLYTQVSQAEQRVSDLEDGKKQQESAISQVQSELEEVQFKLNEMENRSRCSNLRFIGVPQEIESSSSMTKIVTDLIYKCILPEKAMTKDDLSIMRVHRVPSKRASNSNFTLTVLVNFGDCRIKKQILSQAKRTRNFNSGDNFRFRVFLDVSIAAAHQWHEFVGLTDDFKRLGSPLALCN
ncbi:hypothetical protein NDU88_003599 [Pleurodeles waltl]|uniref:L1 transposable element RRM domain-containing protein n=1 Tax=Pleurodeles waltl TaxID=8319 RepID=A0AAV7T619_PLEWA|nr:hypothetical protein NDU88_003599 [Pleurodeles waltl]